MAKNLPPKTNVYIDGFNFYYGAFRNTQFKWLNLDSFCRRILPKNDIVEIKYFTAKISARPHDPDQPIRQNMYLRALRTLPSVSVVYGHFLPSIAVMPLAQPVPGLPATVKVLKTEEKGSDVNLATHLLWDGVQNRYDVAVVVSNDSDLLEPIKLVRHELGKAVGLVNPQKRCSRALLPHVDFVKHIPTWALAASQFPPTLVDAIGTITKPASW